MPSQLIVQNLCYSIHNRILLHNVNLEFSVGQLHGILGPNGSGKSTLLKAMARVWKPSCGHVLWNHLNLLNYDQRSISQLIALVSHHPQVSFDFRVQDIVAMGRYPHNSQYWHKKEFPFVEKAMHDVDIWHLRERSMMQLSQGERQRVYIARAVTTQTPIILLDEPTSNLDLKHQLVIWKLLRQFVELGKLVIVTTHDILAAHKFCDNVAILSSGRCKSQGPPQHILNSSCLKEIFDVENLP